MQPAGEAGSIRRTDRAFRPRKKTVGAVLLERSLRASALLPAEDDEDFVPPSSLARLAVKALGLALPDELSDREARLLKIAETSPRPACDYLSLTCLSWARRAVAESPERELALVAAVALDALAREPGVAHDHLCGTLTPLLDKLEGQLISR